MNYEINYEYDEIPIQTNTEENDEPILAHIIREENEINLPETLTPIICGNNICNDNNNLSSKENVVVKTKEEIKKEENDKILDKLTTLYYNILSKYNNENLILLKFRLPAMCIDEVKFIPSFSVKKTDENIKFILRLESPEFLFKNYHYHNNDYKMYCFGTKRMLIKEITFDSVRKVMSDIRIYLNTIRFCKTKTKFYTTSIYEINKLEVELYQNIMIEYKCPICLEVGDCELTTKCGHYLCFICYSHLFKLNKLECPICKKEKAVTRVIKYNQNKLCDNYESDDEYSSESDYDDDDEDEEDYTEYEL
jgi:hypothetical protein